jgi:hypothetical protein
MQDEQLKQIISETFTAFFARLQAADAKNDDFTNAYATVMAVALDTIDANINSRETMRIAIKVLERFCSGKPGINLMVQECDVPEKGKMQ